MDAFTLGDIIWVILLVGLGVWIFSKPRDPQDGDDLAPRDEGPSPRPNSRGVTPQDLRPPPRPDPARPDSAPPPRREPPEERTPRDVSEAYRRAQATWEALGAPPAGPGERAATAASATPGAPGGFDVEEFLRGAKMVYARIQESWDARDMDDIREFVDDQVFANLSSLAAGAPASARTAILTIDAALLDVAMEKGQEVASVRFEARLSKGGATPHLVREVWHFGRAPSGKENGAAEPSMWKVVGIKQMG